jgi:hypothetical protein
MGSTISIVVVTTEGEVLIFTGKPADSGQLAAGRSLDDLAPPLGMNAHLRSVAIC